MPVVPLLQRTEIAVISDPHIGKGRRFYHKKERPLDNVDELRRLFREINVNEPISTPIVVLGDISQHGRADELAKFELARDEILALGRKVYVVGGNHDAGPFGSWGRESVEERFIKFASRVHRSDEPYPLSVDIGGAVALILVDSVGATIARPWSIARGLVGYTQRQKIKELIADARARGRRVVVALHHHPFFRGLGLELVDSAEFLECIDGAAVCMFGHKHERAEWSNLYGVERFFALPRCTRSLDYLRISLENDRAAQFEYIKSSI